MSDPPPASKQQLLQRLADGDPEERCQILFELAEEQGPIPAPLIYLDDPDPMVQIAAATARWRTRGDVAELPRLVGILRQGLAGDGDLPLMAGTALEQMGTLAVPFLLRDVDPTSPDAPLVVRVLGDIGGPEAIAGLRLLADSPQQEVASEARQALDDWAAEGAANGADGG